MGARQSWSITEVEILQIRNELSTRDDNLKYIFDILVYTGIRISDWEHLANSWNKSQTKWIDVYIPKQSNTKRNVNKTVKRHIMMPELTYNALKSNIYNIKPISESMIKKYVSKINTIAKGLGIDRPISPHDLRATFINLLKHRGYDIFDVKNITQHASLEALIRYFERDTDVVKQAFESLTHDRYDSKHPKLLAKENNRLQDENNILRARIKELEKESE